MGVVHAAGMTLDLETYLSARRRAVDEALERLLPPAEAYPPVIHEAMRYSVMAGGKRLRPILVLAGAEAVGGDPARVMPTACAFELIHTYSLIHDDLPAMDNDDYRRGRLTSHKVFGEAIAVLAGDALLTHAIGLIAANFRDDGVPVGVLPRLLHEVSVAAGTQGMIGGQVVDIQSEQGPVSADTLEYIHTHKTGALMRAAVRAGALLAEAPEAALAGLTTYAEHLGLAFQIVDDVLDIEGSLETLGKTAGKDRQQHKATYPGLYGLDAAKAKAAALVRDAQAVLAPLGARAAPLVALAAFVLERKT